MIGWGFARCDWCGKYERVLTGYTNRPLIPDDWIYQGKGIGQREFCCKEHQEAFNKRWNKEAE